jgi:hypothetical protein
MAYGDDHGVGIRRIPDFAAETTACHFTHRTPPYFFFLHHNGPVRIIVDNGSLRASSSTGNLLSSRLTLPFHPHRRAAANRIACACSYLPARWRQSSDELGPLTARVFPLMLILRVALL